MKITLRENFIFGKNAEKTVAKNTRSTSNITITHTNNTRITIKLGSETYCWLKGFDFLECVGPIVTGDVVVCVDGICSCCQSLFLLAFGDCSWWYYGCSFAYHYHTDFFNMRIVLLYYVYMTYHDLIQIWYVLINMPQLNLCWLRPASILCGHFSLLICKTCFYSLCFAHTFIQCKNYFLESVESSPSLTDDACCFTCFSSPNNNASCCRGT